MGDALEQIGTHIIRIDPRRLKLLDLNARYMRHEVFCQLVDNVKADGALTSVPFAWRLHDDTTRTALLDEEGEPVYEVLSGNHRVKAAVGAGVTEIDVMVTDQYVPPARRRAIQLSHNALTGEDDPATLRAIYDDINDVTWRTYSGLDDKHLALLAPVPVPGLSEVNLQFQPITLLFLPDEVAQVEAIWETVKQTLDSRQGTWLARWTDYDSALDALEVTSTSYGIRNTATAFMVILDVFQRHVTDLQAGWLDEEGQPVEGGRLVSLETVLGSLFVPARVAGQLQRVVERLVSAGDIEAQKRWQALEKVLESFLARTAGSDGG